jgi:hypothetical protein
VDVRGPRGDGHYDNVVIVGGGLQNSMAHISFTSRSVAIAIHYCVSNTPSVVFSYEGWLSSLDNTSDLGAGEPLVEYVRHNEEDYGKETKTQFKADWISCYHTLYLH